MYDLSSCSEVEVEEGICRAVSPVDWLAGPSFQSVSVRIPPGGEDGHNKCRQVFVQILELCNAAV